MALKLRRRVSESGRSLVLRIPKDIERSLQLKAGDEIDIWIEEGKIIIQAIKTGGILGLGIGLGYDLARIFYPKIEKRVL